MAPEQREELKLIKQSQAEELAAARLRWRNPNLPHEQVEREFEELRLKHAAELKPFQAKRGRKPKADAQPKSGQLLSLTEGQRKALKTISRRDGHTLSDEVALLIKWRVLMLRDNPSLNIDDLIRGAQLK